MKRLSTTLLGLLPALVVLVGVNYTVDPANMFHAGCEAELAESIATGNNIRLNAFYNDRLLQKDIIGRLVAPRDVIVLGSSRGMQIRSSQFPGRSFFNHSVAAGTLRDFLAIYQSYVVRNFKPRLVVLEIDPWALDKAFETQRLSSVDADYGLMCRTLGVEPRANVTSVLDSRYADLLSPAYFRTALRQWVRHPWRPRAECDSSGKPAEAPADQSMLLADGSQMYPRRVTEQRRSEVRRQVFGFRLQVGRHTFAVLDPEAQKELEAFLRFLLRQHVQVLLVLPPFHPALRDALGSTLNSAITAAEHYFTSLAGRYNLPIVGSYDPSRSACDETEFIDGAHPKESCMARILSGSRASLPAGSTDF